MAELKDQLSLLGRKTEYKQDYAPEVLEAFDNKHPENDYWVRFNCPEFTSLCPITGQPDFAEIRISYIPDIKMVESKSLKHHHERSDKTDESQIYRGYGYLYSTWRYFDLSVCQLWPSGNEVRTDGRAPVDESGITRYKNNNTSRI